MSSSLIELPQQSLFDIPGCEFTPVSLKLPEDLKFDHWQRIGRQLQLADLAIQWWLGDWLAFGERKWGEKYSQALEEATGRKTQTLMNYAYVAKAIEISRRRENVDFSTHAEVASLEPEDQERILARAANEHLSRSRVRVEVERIKREKRPKAEDDAIVLSKEARSYLDHYMTQLERLAADIPPNCPTLETMLLWHGRHAEWQKDRTRSSDYAAILEMFSFEEGIPGTERASKKEIIAWLDKCSYFMSEPELNERLDLMVEKKMLEVKSVEESRQDGRRGILIDLYALHPDYEAQLGG